MTVTVSDCVIDSVESRSKFEAVLVPAIPTAESSLIATDPALLKVSVPKFRVSVDAWSPKEIDVPARSARFVTVKDAVAASVIAPVESKSRLNAVLAPANPVSEFSLMVTAPALLKVSVPAFNVSVDAWSPKVIEVPARSARFVTVNDAVSASVIAPVESKSRLNAVLVPANPESEFSLMVTAPALLKVSVPAFTVSVDS